MSLFTLINVTRTPLLLGNKQAPAGTPGAVKVTEESTHWYAYRRASAARSRGTSLTCS
jgi:hypothetical protein